MYTVNGNPAMLSLPYLLNMRNLPKNKLEFIPSYCLGMVTKAVERFVNPASSVANQAPVNQQPAPSCPPPEEKIAAEEKEEKEDHENRGAPTCGVCFELEIDTTIIPCGHCFCMGCVTGLKTEKCPKCRANIAEDISASISNNSSTGVILYLLESRKYRQRA